MTTKRTAYLISPGGDRHKLAGQSLILGRSSSCSIIFTHPNVSSRHARLEDQEGYVLLDLGSTNGTFVNGKRIIQTALRSGDRIRLARRAPEFRFEAPDGYPVATVPTLGAKSSIGRRLLWLAGTFAAVGAITLGGWFLWSNIGPRDHSPKKVFDFWKGHVASLTFRQDDGSEIPLGTAFRLAQSHRLLTCAHVVWQRQPQKLVARLYSSTTAPPLSIRIADIMIHPDYQPGQSQFDIAILDPIGQPGRKSPQGAASIDDLDSGNIYAGAPCFTVGFPALGLNIDHPMPSLKNGVISQKFARFLKIDMAIHPGFSGSPLIDQQGRVFAILVGNERSSKLTSETPRLSGFTWAIPLWSVADWIDRQFLAPQSSGRR